MLKKILIIAVLAGGVYYFGFRPTVVDKLVKDVATGSTERAGNSFVEPDYSRRPINDSLYAQSGRITIVYYHLAQCPGCQRLDSDLDSFRAVRPDVAVRKISLAGDWSTEGAIRDFGREIGQTPFVVIYGPNQRVVVEDKGRNGKAFKLLYDWINAELKREWEKKHG